MSTAARKFDPANDRHYAISEDSQLVIRQVIEAMHGESYLFGIGAASEQSNDIIAAKIDCWAFLLQAAVEEKMVFRPRAK